MKPYWKKIMIYSVIVFSFSNCNSQNNQTEMTSDNDSEPLENRKAAVAGRFYSADPDELTSDLKNLFSNAKPKQVEDNVLAIISPHAGYVFSGGIAASSYNQIDPNKKYNTIFLIGPSHRASFSGASIYSKGNYNTPMGTVDVDRNTAQKLIDEHNFFHFYKDVHMFEHSLEVQLPFLQYIMKEEFSIVPILIGSQDKMAPKKIASALQPYFNSDNLFIISTDFSHYPSYSDACKVDKATADAICTNKPDNFLKTIKENSNSNINNLQTSICGWTSVLTLMYITEKSNVTYEQIQYKNSGESAYGDKSRVVGYYSIAVVESDDASQSSHEESEIAPIEENEYTLTDEEKKTLLKLARYTINEYIKKGITPKLDASNYSEALQEHCGAFVTLHKKDGSLRGCIGRFEPDEPLYEVVKQMAISSATKDYRFTAVKEEEIEKLDIEISVLTPMKKIESIDEIELGKHGIYIKKGFSGGTFLPQVANQTGWTKEEFLGHCARDKARIGWEGWKDADIFIYEALVFSEKDFVE